jgi:hypothetical protein
VAGGRDQALVDRRDDTAGADVVDAVERHEDLAGGLDDLAAAGPPRLLADFGFFRVAALPSITVALPVATLAGAPAAAGRVGERLRLVMEVSSRSCRAGSRTGVTRQ